MNELVSRAIDQAGTLSGHLFSLCMYCATVYGALDVAETGGCTGASHGICNRCSIERDVERGWRQ
jgi:hypothetical protein